jgi:hypothetical protein
MNILDVFDDRMLNINTSVDHSREEIDLYKHLNLALELMKNDSFTVEDSGLGKKLWYSITTPYPDGLPENIGTMFFNVNNNFDVKVEETQIYAGKGKRHFQVFLNKV